MTRKITRDELRRILGDKGGATPDKRPRCFAKAKPTTVNGIRFASKTEAVLYRRLLLRQRGSPGSLLLRQVRFDLPALSDPDVDPENASEAPETWKPDFVFVDPVEISEDGTPLWTITVHEAKGSKGTESRDFKLRLRAFRVSYPNIPVMIWRSVGRGKITCDVDA